MLDRSLQADPVSLLESLSSVVGMTSARTTVDRVVAEREGVNEDDWTDRMTRWGDTCGLEMKPVELSPREAAELAGAGEVLVTAIPDRFGDDRYVILTGGTKSKVEFVRFDTNARESMRVSRWAKEWGIDAKVARTFLSVVPQLPCANTVDAPHAHGTMSLIAGAWRLVRPDVRDLRVVLVFALFIGMLALATPIAVEALVNTVAFGRLVQPIIILSVILGVCLLFASVLRLAQTFVVELLQRRLMVRVVTDLSRRLPRVKQTARDKESIREASNRFLEIVTVQKVASLFLLDGLWLVLQATIGLTVIAFYHPVLLVFDVFIVGLTIIGLLFLGRNAVKTSVKESKSKYRILSWLEEIAANDAAFRSSEVARFAANRADELTGDYLSYRQTHFRILFRQITFILLLQALASTVLLAIGGWLVMRGELTLGQLVAAELIVTVLLGSLAKLGKHLEAWYDVMASTDKLQHLFALPTDKPGAYHHPRLPSPASVRCRNVSFEYLDDRPVLQDLYLDLPAGDRIAVLGRSGGGKSTLLDLLVGYRTPTRGHIELDGVDLREIRTDSLREQAVLLRDIEVIAGSISENVHLHRSYVDSTQVREALRLVGLLDELLELPDGLQTELGERGQPLSQGQLVRLMIARGIVDRPRLILIDQLIDRLPEELIPEVVDNLVSSSSPWSLIIVTGREDVARFCPHRVDLASLQKIPADRIPRSLSVPSNRENGTQSPSDDASASHFHSEGDH